MTTAGATPPAEGGHGPAPTPPTEGEHGLAPTPAAMRHALAGYPTGIALVTAELEGRVVGMLANSFSSVSLDPPLVSVAFARTSTTWPVLQQVEQWGISVLGDRHADLVALLSRPAADRFDGIQMARCVDGVAVLPEALAAFTVTRHAEVDAGDHVLALLRVVGVHRDPQQDPLVFYGSALRRLDP